MTSQPLSDTQRRAIHDLALDARSLLTREARELLEGTYGLYPEGRLDPPEKLPQVRADPETGQTYRRLAQFLEDEERAGLARPEAVEKLVKEVAFTHLNRLVAFKMMEARGLIRGTLDKGTDSNGFKFYLADPEHGDDLACYERGNADTAYRHFLLWQSGRVAQEVRVLFDPDTLPSRLFPRPRALNALLEMLNRPELASAWRADETIGWVYQYFNEPELQAAFEKVRTSGAKFEAKDIPSATQLFTPHWIVRFLVHNTLGRLWVRMHPDTRLIDTDPSTGSGRGLLDYLVPLEGEVPPEPLRPVKEITLLDPACGGMHFGLVAFDLFAAMYQEELERAGEPGWPVTPSVSDPSEISAAILADNLFGIDIDLRAVQLSALALYLKAKALSPKAQITDSNLACADVLPLDGAKLGAFLREARFTRPIYERLIRALWERLRDVTQLGSLLRLERELGELIAQERAQYEKAPLFAGLEGEFEREAAEEEFWDIISAQIIQGLDEFALQQAQAGVDQAFFTGEAVKGLRLLDLMLRRYDVVVTNPPYMTRGKMNNELANLVADAYPEGKNDLFAAFIQRCLEFSEDRGYVGMLTMHTFMFLSSYGALREGIRRQAAIEAMAHCGPALFDVGNPGTLQTTAFVLRRELDTPYREARQGSYFRLIHELDSEAKRQTFEQALRNGSNTHHAAQQRFDAIPGSPWIYWVGATIANLFKNEAFSSLGESYPIDMGLKTSGNERFIRWWWEVSRRMRLETCDRQDAIASGARWFPYAKGAARWKWAGAVWNCVVWQNDGHEIKEHLLRQYPYLNGDPGWCTHNEDLYFSPVVVWGTISSAGFSASFLDRGNIISNANYGVFAPEEAALRVLGVFHSRLAQYLLGLLSPTINFNKGEVEKLPLADLESSERLARLSLACVNLSDVTIASIELSPKFCAPFCWDTGLDDLTAAQARLTALESQIDDEVYRLYGISDEDRAAIEAELAGGSSADEETEDEAEPEPPMTRQELAVRWISYAVGVVLGRFQPGLPPQVGGDERGGLGSAIYRRADFAVGSLPAPDTAEFDQLVGPVEHFAYVDADGGRHLFSAEVESALRDLALPDGIAVLDEGHEKDLPALVKKALQLMLDWGADTEHAARKTHEVIEIGAGGDLRRFFERHFFTQWHFRWYRKRPVYWPLQSARRSYGFVLFHERVDRSTLYVLQRDYLDHKLNGLRLQIGDLRGQAEALSGAARKRVERQMDRTTQQLDEITEFAATMERVVREGHEPAPDWIDDGVILRMAPLWELIPIWWREPKKYWERLGRGDYDWSHIAMRYWPERVREKGRTNKSFAIAHGYEEWYQGA